jgi:hypothetical protein
MATTALQQSSAIYVVSAKMLQAGEVSQLKKAKHIHERQTHPLVREDVI